ncbi:MULTISPECIES: hypothetical protein [Clavibacter]|uniref:Uncharacterized protein n=1 Tax=Clavibacter tessellarius TaxID=31965 RepID=A0A154UYA9_9MICO|nr:MULTISPECIES: hypothetical protein [Clavibacter]KZC93934.1 hypothetical protein AWH51_00780 [Clavibacter michiganensis subsp. tessellarius]MDA3804341.1 hypothetical protein [Clavibacter sp. CT19]
MTPSFALRDALALGDLQTFLGRSARVDDGAVRLIGSGGVLAVYTSVLQPAGLLDRAPTVLGLRTFAADTRAPVDSVVPIRALLDRLARLEGPATGSPGEPVGVLVPPDTATAAWAGISPPRAGWERVDDVAAAALRAAARAGIDEVAAAVPSGIGEQIVSRVRGEVWGRPVDGAPDVVAGGAFAAYSLGFLGPDPAPDAEADDDEPPVAVFRAGPWMRLTTSRGHVLIRRL